MEPGTLFLYKALQRHAKFVVNSKGVALNFEPRTHLQFLEVQSEAAVTTPCHRDVLPIENVWIAFASRHGNRFNERHVSIATEKLVDISFRVEAQNARIRFVDQHTLIATQERFYIAAKFRVGVPIWLFGFPVLLRSDVLTIALCER